MGLSREAKTALKAAKPVAGARVTNVTTETRQELMDAGLISRDLRDQLTFKAVRELRG